MIGLVDCNNFFVSCERSIDRSLEGKAVVVMSNNDGCAIARSNEAKALGIKMGQPMFELRNLINSNQLIAISANHLLYHEISTIVHDIFHKYSPNVIDYSIDEAFLDMTRIPDIALYEIGRNIYDECRLKTGIPVTIGFSFTKTLAKVATDLGKKHNKHIILLSDKKEINDILSKTNIGDIWGIGRKLTKRLYFSGIMSAKDFISKDINWINKEFGINGVRTYNELRLIPSIDLDSCNRDIQSTISETRTFASDTNDFNFIQSQISLFASDCAKRLRQMHACCSSITIFMATNPYRFHHQTISPNIQITFKSPTNSSSSIIKAANDGLMQIYSPSISYKRAGIILSEIAPDNSKQLTLFEDESEDLHKSTLMTTIDKINQENNRHSLRLASEIPIGITPKNTENLSSFHYKK
ncbi:MAG: Y-family DNA polymerase [Bacteroidales bacterium]|nr:Y-family DNA polymerase [Bacteroidales bacterium]